MPKEKKCDGYLDCRSGKDEEGCTGVACQLSEFRCASGSKCIDASLKCNHKNDCGDNSDEHNCSTFFKHNEMKNNKKVKVQRLFFILIF